MRDDSINYLVAGGLVFAALVGMIVSIAVLSGRTGPTDTYYISYDNVLGLDETTQVLYEGMPVGRVEHIGRGGGDGAAARYRVQAAVTKGWEIPHGSTGVITASGLLSDVVIDIRAGREPGFLDPGDSFEGIEAVNPMEAVAGVADDVSEITSDVLKPLLADLSDRIPRVAANLEEFSVQMNASSAALREILDEENVESVATILANVERTSAEMDALLLRVKAIVDENRSSIETSLADLEYTLDSVARHIDAINHNLEGTVRNSNEFTRRIRDDPSLVLRGTRPADDTRKTSHSP